MNMTKPSDPWSSGIVYSDNFSSWVVLVDEWNKFSNMRHEYWPGASDIIVHHDKFTDWVSDG